MRKYIIKLPRDVEVDVFNLPENFKEIVEETFSQYTDGTSKDYRYCDKLSYIDILIANINNARNSYDVVNKLVKERFAHEWEEFGQLITEDDIYSSEFMEECYSAGVDNASLYSRYGTDDHHIYDQIQKVVVKVITIIMNYREK